jgi:hypothetical protein
MGVRFRDGGPIMADVRFTLSRPSRRRFLHLGAMSASAVAFGPYLSRVTAVGATTSTVVLTPPSTIDATGTTDVAAALNSWLLAAAPQAGDTVKLAGRYLLTDSFKTGDPQHPIAGVTFDLTQATLTMPQLVASQYGRPVLRCANLHDCRVQGGTIIGANRTGADAVQAGNEGWGGISVSGGSTNVTLSGQTVENVWGDFVGIGGGPNQDIYVDHLTGQVTGRHAISVRHAEGLTITNSTFRNIRHLFFDHEAHSGDALTGLEIGNCVSTTGGLGIFMQLLPLTLTACGNIWVHDHTLTNGHYRVVAGTGGVQRDGLRFERCTNAPAVATASPLIKIGGTAAGWNHVIIRAVQDRVTNRATAVQSTNCPDPQIDLSGFTT